MSPAPSLRHQKISTGLAIALNPRSMRRTDLFEAINLRLQRRRIPIPDLVIAHDVDVDGKVSMPR